MLSGCTRYLVGGPLDGQAITIWDEGLHPSVSMIDLPGGYYTDRDNLNQMFWKEPNAQ